MCSGRFPDYNSKLLTRPLSITTSLVVNPYSQNVTDASKFAEFATSELAGELYSYTGMLSTHKNIEYDEEYLSQIYDSYAKSAPKTNLCMANRYIRYWKLPCII